jgi:hypothetical protein
MGRGRGWTDVDKSSSHQQSQNATFALRAETISFRTEDGLVRQVRRLPHFEPVEMHRKTILAGADRDEKLRPDGL